MQRPHFTVEVKEGMCFDANHIYYSWNVTAGWVVSFVCSGEERRFDIDRIKEIRFAKSGATYCNECDGPVPEREKV